MKAIYKREVSSYFNSMIGWIFVAVLTVFIGIYFFAYNLFQGYPYFSLSLGSSLFIFMVVVPILTMRSMADERHTKTDQLLLTAPVSVTAVVLGKYFAMLTVFAVPVAIACLCPLIIALNGHGLPVGGLRRHSGLLPAGRGGDRRGHADLLSDGEPDHRRSGHLRPAAPAVSVGTAWWAFCPPPPSGLCWASSWC